MWGRTWPTVSIALPRAAELLAAHDAHPERRRRRRADQPALVVVGRDVAHHDPVVAERGAGEQPLEGVEQRLVAAPVDRQRLLHGGGVGGLEVGRDVAAAERVDRLLGVADQHHRGVPAEGPVEDLPLHRVGVLELVDEHDAPPLPHPLRGGPVGVGEGVGELGEEVVVRQDPEAPLAPVELVADGAGEADPATDGRGAVLVGGLRGWPAGRRPRRARWRAPRVWLKAGPSASKANARR